MVDWRLLTVAHRRRARRGFDCAYDVSKADGNLDATRMGRKSYGKELHLTLAFMRRCLDLRQLSHV